MEIILKDGTYYTLLDEDYNRYLRTYRTIDVDQELLEMESWCLDNPSKRKTRRGAKSFINAWLCRASKRKPLDRTVRSSRDTTLEQDLNSRDWANA